eukprot:1169426-Pyramimonas_sp.AAC.1
MGDFGNFQLSEESLASAPPGARQMVASESFAGFPELLDAQQGAASQPFFPTPPEPAPAAASGENEEVSFHDGGDMDVEELDSERAQQLLAAQGARGG